LVDIMYHRYNESIYTKIGTFSLFQFLGVCFNIVLAFCFPNIFVLASYSKAFPYNSVSWKKKRLQNIHPKHRLQKFQSHVIYC